MSLDVVLSAGRYRSAVIRRRVANGACTPVYDMKTIQKPGMSTCCRIYVALLLVSFLAASVQGKNATAKPGAITELAKCCPLGEALGDDAKNCAPSKLPFEPTFWGKEPPPTEVGLVVGLKCKYGRYRLEPHIDSNDEFKLAPNGSLYVPYHFQQMLPPTDYCLETFETDDGPMVLPLICFSPLPPENTWKEFAMVLYSIGCLISVPFLLLTLLVYCFTPSLRTDETGKVLCCHVACLTIAYFSLSIVLLTGSILTSTICILVAFSIQFSFLASFFWLNVLCFNTWRKLRTAGKVGELRRRTRSETNRKNRRFLYYSLYAWSMPVFFVVITLAMDISPSVPSSYLKPNFGMDSCWFREDSTALPYFYAPMACILVANLLMFIHSAFSVNKNTVSTTTKLVSMRQVAIETIKQRRKTVFVECLILFLVMGLNWVFEVISWAVGGPPQIWFITDLFNTLQGTIVFYVFVVREERARESLKALLTCTRPPGVIINVNGNPLLQP